MTSRQYGKRAVFVSGDVRFQNGDAVDLGELGGGGRFLPYSRLEIVYVVIMYTHRTIVLLWSSGLYDIRVHFNVRRVAYSTD